MFQDLIRITTFLERKLDFPLEINNNKTIV